MRPVARRILASGSQTRKVAMAAMNASSSKKEGSIADAFVSLSGTDRPALPKRFLELKQQLVSGHEEQIISSWKRLLSELRTENETIARKGPSVVPDVEFKNIERDLPALSEEIHKRGVAVIRGVVPENEARDYKFEIEDYVKKNPQTRSFPPDDPQVYELYWSAPQLKARAHPNLIKASTAMMSLWHLSDPSSQISLTQPLSYADRLRIRQPGDAKFALGPHIDGGSVERWEKDGYGRGGVYDRIFAGDWKSHDPWDASTRVPAVTDLYDGLGACSMFRMFQGWLSMSHVGPREGTLLVNPLLQLASSYTLLRPFFHPFRNKEQCTSAEEFLNGDNWGFTGGAQMTSELQGATPGHGQELNDALHPHLELDKAMVHVPKVKPGDFVVWHCDTIHAVDKTHAGTTDSSVLYIPVCPVTEINAKYLARQRAAFLDGTPGPDFPGGAGESGHRDRPTEQDLRQKTDIGGLRAAGFEKLVARNEDTVGSRNVINQANIILGF